MSADRIERKIEFRAPVAKVWEAITDHKRFGAWFQARIDQPFEVGALTTGHMTIPGFEHLPWKARILRMEKEKLFAFEWPPYVPDKEDLSHEPWQLVEFRLEPTATGTLLTLTESGFSKISAAFRDDARRGNEQGWDFQAKNLSEYVAKNQ